MRIEYTFRNMESSEAMKNYAEGKLGRLQKYVRGPLEVAVTFSLERHLQVVDVAIHADGHHLQGREGQEDMYASIDLVTDKIQRQLNKAHEQHAAHRRGPSAD
ncbi:MAG: ribosome-associated translation inhibitor RaiA [Myxococcales bacterium]|nr:ribosome-associated translation inhibitor RaiA [Myxococcales bacterium]